MDTNLLTPLFDEFTEQFETFKANVNERIAQAQATILATLAGVDPSAAIPDAAPSAPGQKRTPAELERVTEIVYRVIAKHPGERIEQLAERVGMETAAMVLPIKKLRAAKRITSKGAKRATAYFAKA